MSANIFNSSLIKTFDTKNRGVGVGEWTTRNGVAAMDIRPEPFYQNLEGGTVSGFLRGCFATNTSYVVDMWIDADDVIYNGNNVPAGFTLVYTDGTTESFIFTGGNRGFQHKRIITPASKTIDRLESYYYVSEPVYYRWDSYIAKADEAQFEKTGIVSATHVIENTTDVSVYKGGSLYVSNIIEN